MATPGFSSRALSGVRFDRFVAAVSADGSTADREPSRRPRPRRLGCLERIRGRGAGGAESIDAVPRSVREGFCSTGNTCRFFGTESSLVSIQLPGKCARDSARARATPAAFETGRTAFCRSRGSSPHESHRHVHLPLDASTSARDLFPGDESIFGESARLAPRCGCGKRGLACAQSSLGSLERA